MKPKKSSVLSYIRIAIASALVIASVGLASVAIKQSVAFKHRDFAFEKADTTATEPGAPTALALKLARNARFAPQTNPDSGESPDSWAQQDWLEHSMDGGGNGPPAFTRLRVHVTIGLVYLVAPLTEPANGFRSVRPTVKMI